MRLAALLLVLPLAAAAQQSAPVVRVEYSNPGGTPTHWTLVLRANGQGNFRAEPAKPAPGLKTIEVPTIDRGVQISPDFAGRVFRVATSDRVLGNKCESHLRVAFQGWKTIQYQGPEGKGSCTFNYSRDRQIQEMGESLVAVAATLIEGARLELLRQHDPLGLDRETSFMVEGAADGRLQQIGAIRNILESLEQDPAVMEMVRKRIRILLARAER
ncbi:MAG TPA: hypothetical protein VF392_17195 [Terracidiphilus sp.]